VCGALASLIHTYLGSFFLDPEDIIIIIIIIIIIYLTANGLSPGGSGYNACT
jgi:hypothetical protein